MSEDKIKKRILDLINYIRFNDKPEFTAEDWYKAIEELYDLNYLKGRQLKKKDKIIDLMAEHIEKGCDFDNKIQTKQQILDYFTKKVDE